LFYPKLIIYEKWEEIKEIDQKQAANKKQVGFQNSLYELNKK